MKSGSDQKAPLAESSAASAESFERLPAEAVGARLAMRCETPPAVAAS